MIFSKSGGILPDEIIEISLKEGFDFNSIDSGMPTRDFESMIFTKSAERDVKATILYLFFLFEYSFENTLCG